MKKFSFLLSIMLCMLFLPLIAAWAQHGNSKTDLVALSDNIFLGQIYPSGNIYLTSFSEKAGDASFWPKEISVFGLGTDKADTGKPVKASFVKVMASKIEDNVILSIYIPGFEKMDDEHYFCGIGKNKKDPNFKYLSHDFFYAVLDNCEMNDGIALYHTSPSKKYSYMVIAFGSQIQLSDYRIFLRNQKRPLTSDEQKEVIKAKQEAEKSSDDYECTTVPAYLDSAVQLFSAELAGTDIQLRVSTYDTPGCAGHWASVYILDFLKGNKLLRTIEHVQYRGVI